jgi:hypothetical protein
MLFLVVAGAVIVVGYFLVTRADKDAATNSSGGDNSNPSDHGKYSSLAACLSTNRPPNLSTRQATDASGQPWPASAAPPSVLITHANVWTGRDALRTDADVLLVGGKISAVSPFERRATHSPYERSIRHHVRCDGAMGDARFI